MMTSVAKPLSDDIPTQTYDAIIVGGGHNGLVCAAYLAKAGKKILVLEQRHILGGAAASDEIFPGFTFSVYSYVVSLFRPRIIRELALTRHGYQVIPLECTFTPFPDGESLTRCGDPHATRREIARFSPKDAEVAPRFSLAMTKMACPPPLDALERAFIQAMAGTVSVKRSCNTLDLLDASGKVQMVLRAN